MLRPQGRGPPVLSRNSGKNSSEAKLKGRIRRRGHKALWYLSKNFGFYSKIGKYWRILSKRIT